MNPLSLFRQGRNGQNSGLHKHTGTQGRKHRGELTAEGGLHRDELQAGFTAVVNSHDGRLAHWGVGADTMDQAFVHYSQECTPRGVSPSLFPFCLHPVAPQLGGESKTPTRWVPKTKFIPEQQ